MQGDRGQQRVVATEKRQTSNLRNRKIASIAKRVNADRGTVITLRKKPYISAFKLLTLLLVSISRSCYKGRLYALERIPRRAKMYNLILRFRLKFLVVDLKEHLL
ncbi:hypothetical protein K504DRAFT_453669 [Pleomassaria siparia CBS 279.74]|uniref:Uncharacterized protein n=1 Tax=Pleomassaria siparia CBS 279.74 TaxID=1314801 RepID=A0A6G1KHK9_9PLEO|nr:hypothetical protein K504DRAFT_453669 [Pleomassaria siparia CBS 279.74]